jgi:hypothetical protein
MPVMAELFRKRKRELVMVGKLSIIVALYERLGKQKSEHYIKFDGRLYLDKDIETLRDKYPELF